MSPFTRRRFLVAAAALTGTAAMARPGRAEVRVWRGSALGGEASIRLWGEPDAADAALRAAVAELRRLEAIFSLYDPTSALVRLNRSGRLEAPPLDLVQAIHLAEHWRLRTEGAFDARIQPLWHARAERGDVAAAAATVQATAVDATPAAIALSTGALTLNGLAQGFVTDRLTALLQAQGFSRAAVDAGELRLVGPARHPVELPELGLTLEVADRAIGVSVPGTLRFADGSAHIVHPSGRSAPEPWQAIAVLAPDATTADTLSTAASLLPPDAVAACVAAMADVHVVARSAAGALHRFGRGPVPALRLG